MSITSADVIRVAPEFSSEDAGTFTYFIAQAALYVNSKFWKEKTDMAHALFTAHLMKSRGTSGGLGVPGGPIQSSKVGDLSRTYAVAVPAGGSYSNTSYGQLFEQLRKTILTSPFIATVT